MQIAHLLVGQSKPRLQQATPLMPQSREAVWLLTLQSSSGMLTHEHLLDMSRHDGSQHVHEMTSMLWFRLLARLGTDLLTQPETADARLQEFCEAACHDQHTLALAQAVLMAVRQQRPDQSAPLSYAMQVGPLRCTSPGNADNAL